MGEWDVNNRKQMVAVWVKCHFDTALDVEKVEVEVFNRMMEKAMEFKKCDTFTIRRVGKKMVAEWTVSEP